MKSLQKFFLILISFCLFFNVAIGRTWNFDFTHHSSKESSFLKTSQIKKSNILIDFDFETSAEEGFQEETDSDDGEFNYLVSSPFEFSFDYFKRKQKSCFSQMELRNSLKVPLFIKFRNLRL